MVKLFRTELTPSGRPVLLHGEVERGMLDKVDLMFYGTAGGVDGAPSDEYRDGHIILTNYRLIWVSATASSAGAPAPAGSAAPAAGVPCHLPLPAVSDAEHRPGRLIKPARIKLAVRVDGASYPTPDPRSVACIAAVKVVCRGRSPEVLHSQLMAALERRAWAAMPPGMLQQLHPVPAISPLAGGVVAGRVGPRPVGERQPQPASAPAGVFQPDWAIVQGLCVIGYPRLHAVNAVVATRNAGVQQAVEWLLDHEGSPALDQPSAFLGGSSAGGGGSSSSGSNTAQHSSGTAQHSSGGGGSSGAGPGWTSSAAGDANFSNPLLAGLQQQQAMQPHWSELGGRGSGGTGGPGSTPASLQAGPLRGGGVNAILQRVQEQVDATGSTMDQAFTDLSQLMKKAEEMVALAQYFRERVAAGREGSTPSEGEEELDAETALGLVELGIVSPVTRDTAGSLYFQELARQLSDFLAAPMERAGGMMPLPDVYCLYNRARGTELISPDDLAAAVKMFPKIQAPHALREFSSGVKVIQSASHSDEAICRRIAQLVAAQPASSAHASSAHAAGTPAGAAEAALLCTLGPSITRLEVALSLAVPLAIAGEHLSMAEAQGVVCRDDSSEGLRYFRNFFPDFAA